MQVSVETLNDLERRLTVQVPAERVAKEIQDRLATLSRQVKVHGFRPGKVPLKLIQRMYGEQARYEAVSELVEHSLRDALVQEKLQPLGGPKIEPRPLEEGQDLEYSATFEVLPEFTLSGVESLQIERPVAEVTELDVDTMVETLRWQRAIWNAVERSARAGDRVRFDLSGTIDGQDFAGNKSEDQQVVLGKKAILPEFEAQLVGLGASAAAEFDLTFPADYQSTEIAGKTAHFQIQVHEVEEAALPDLDEAFAANFDVKDGGLPALRQSLHQNMERELREGIQTAIKRQVMQGLLDVNAVPLPRALIGAEIEQLASQLRFPAGGSEQQIALKTKLFEVEARRRVALGLLISKLATEQGIQVSQERVRARLEAMADTYEKPGELLRWYEETPNALDSLRALVLEEQVVDWVLERAQVSERPSTFAEIMTPDTPPVLQPAESAT